MDYSQSYSFFKGLYGAIRKPKDLKDAKYIADTLIDLIDEESHLLSAYPCWSYQPLGPRT